MDGMYLQWGFTENGVELINKAVSIKNINLDRDDVETVYVEKKKEEKL